MVNIDDPDDVDIDNNSEEVFEHPEELDVIDEGRVHQAVEDLSADARRCEGSLKRADVERLYFKRQLHPQECLQVEKALKSDGISIEDSEEEIETDVVLKASPHEVVELIKQSKREPYLTEADERQYGRTIQLYLRAQEEQLNSNPLDSSEFSKLKDRAEAATKKLIISNLRYVAHVAIRHGF